MILFPGRHLMGVLEFHHISYFEKWKLWAMFVGRFLRQANYDRKKGTVVWPLVRMFGGSMSLDCFGRFLNQITTRKKVQLSGHWLQCLGGRFHELGLFLRVCWYVFWWVPQSNYKLRQKKVQSPGHWLEINTESEYNSNLQIGMALSIK